MCERDESVARRAVHNDVETLKLQLLFAARLLAPKFLFAIASDAPSLGSAFKGDEAARELMSREESQLPVRRAAGRMSFNFQSRRRWRCACRSL